MAATTTIQTDNAQNMTFRVSGRQDQPPSHTCSSFPLLDLPYEVRLQIYNLVFSVDPNTTLSHAAHPPKFHMTRRLPSMSLLLASSQLYHEARLLPLRCNTFDFFRWYSSNVFECRQFLRKLQPWQTGQVRSIQLAVTEADLKRPDPEIAGTSDSECCLLEVCEAVGPSLRHLELDISVVFDPSFDWYSAASYWLQNGLVYFSDLRSLGIILGKKVTVTSGDLESFRSQLSRMLPKCSTLSVQSLKLEAEKEEAMKEAERLARIKKEESTPLRAIEVHQTLIFVPDVSV